LLHATLPATIPKLNRVLLLQQSKQQISSCEHGCNIACNILKFPANQVAPKSKLLTKSIAGVVIEGRRHV
jgi:hypothetical protein